MSNIRASTESPNDLSIMRWRSPGTNIQERNKVAFSMIKEPFLGFRISDCGFRILGNTQIERFPIRNPQSEILNFLIRLRHAEHVLAEEGEHHVVAHRSGYQEASFPKLPLHIVIASKPIASVRGHANISGFPG